ncbi:MAG: hypothetical protein K1X28_09745 [Parachlamydiales bacterium]|nr:hypothetical protein [Parachlamydiales bacterium]
MSALSLESSREPFIVEEPKINGKVIAKALLVALVIAGLATAVFFSATALMSLAASGAAGWAIGLTAVGCLASVVSLLGAGHFSVEHRMFEDTDDNGSDAWKFIRDTLGTGFYVGAYGIDIVREWQIWDMIFSR